MGIFRPSNAFDELPFRSIFQLRLVDGPAPYPVPYHKKINVPLPISSHGSPAHRNLYKTSSLTIKLHQLLLSPIGKGTNGGTDGPMGLGDFQRASLGA